MDELTKTFNYEKLHEVTKIVANNLNRIIDINFYPTEKPEGVIYYIDQLVLGFKD